MAREKRATWFKIFLHQKPLIDSVPSQNVGDAVKAALQYFENKDEPKNLDPLTFAVFSSMKPYVDESLVDYEASVEKGRAGGQKRWEKEKNSVPPVYPPYTPPIGLHTEADTEAEADADAYAEDKCLMDNVVGIDFVKSIDPPVFPKTKEPHFIEQDRKQDKINSFKTHFNME